MPEFQKLPPALLPWYDLDHRQLPWRQTRDPYRIWISEIMLQQTRVEAVVGYYARFLEACPDVHALANASDEVLHKLWEGLGYYSRVRNLKKAAQVIEQVHGGVFPRDYASVLALPGIGEYTAGAISSIAYDLPVPAVDGNVLRVVSRITDDATPIDDPKWKRRVREHLAAIYPERAGDFTQSLMELGATLCGPNRKPQCTACPCKDFCLGYLRGTAEALPVKAPKKKRRTEEMTLFIMTCDGKYAIRKRADTGLLAGLWEFPNVEGTLTEEEAAKAVADWGLTAKAWKNRLAAKHIFTHVEWHMTGYTLEVAGDAPFVWVNRDELEQRAVPSAFARYYGEVKEELKERG